MSFIFAIEALKFYKLKSEWTARLLFLLAFLLNCLPLLLQEQLRSLGTFFEKLTEFVRHPGNAEVAGLYASAGPDLMVLFLSYLALFFAGILISVAYGIAYLGARQKRAPRAFFPAFLRSLPWVTLLFLAVLLVALLTAMVLFIPALILLLSLIFLPFLAADPENKTDLERGGNTASSVVAKPVCEEVGSATKPGHGRLRSLLGEAVRLSEGRKRLIFISFFLLHLIFGAMRDLVLALLPDNILILTLLQAAFNAATILMRGRLAALYYFIFRYRLKGRSLPDYLQSDPADVYEDVTGERRMP